MRENRKKMNPINSLIVVLALWSGAVFGGDLGGNEGCGGPCVIHLEWFNIK